MSSRPAAARALVAAGRLQWHSEADRALFQHALAQHDGKVVSLTVKRHAETRSQRQNRWYWGVILPAIAEETGEDRDSLHEVFKRMFLPDVLNEPPDAARLTIVHPQTGAVLAGGEDPAWWTTTRLDTGQFGEYLERVRQWSAYYLGLDIPDPDSGLAEEAS